MKKDEKFIIFSAHSTHKIIECEKMFLENNIDCRIIPLPSEVSASCGLAIKVSLNYLETCQNLISKNNFDLDTYLVEKLGFSKIVVKL